MISWKNIQSYWEGREEIYETLHCNHNHGRHRHYHYLYKHRICTTSLNKQQEKYSLQIAWHSTARLPGECFATEDDEQLWPWQLILMQRHWLTFQYLGTFYKNRRLDWLGKTNIHDKTRYLPVGITVMNYFVSCQFKSTLQLNQNYSISTKRYSAL